MHVVLSFIAGAIVGLGAGIFLMKKYGAMIVAAITSLEATIKSSIQRIESAIQRVENAIKAAKGIVGILILCLLCSLAASAQTARKPQTQLRVRTMATTGTVATGIAFNWAYPYTTPPACPTNGTLANCVNGFTLTDTSTNTVIATPAQIPISATSYTWTPNGGLYFGTHCFTMVTNGFDGNGAPLVSGPSNSACVTNNLTSLNPPTGLAGTAR